MEMPQLFQICQFSSIIIHGQTQSPPFKRLSSLLVNLGQFYDKKSDALPLGIKEPARLSNFPMSNFPMCVTPAFLLFCCFLE